MHWSWIEQEASNPMLEMWGVHLKSLPSSLPYYIILIDFSSHLSKGDSHDEDISEFESVAIIVWQICVAIQVTCLFAKQLRHINTSPRYMCNVFTLLALLEITHFIDFHYKQSIVIYYTCRSRNGKIGKMEYCIIHTKYLLSCGWPVAPGLSVTSVAFAAPSVPSVSVNSHRHLLPRCQCVVEKIQKAGLSRTDYKHVWHGLYFNLWWFLQGRC